MATIDKQYEVMIGGSDFSDIISMDNGVQYTIQSFSSQSATGQDTDGRFYAPILGERVQLVFTCPPYIKKSRFKQLVTALEMGSKGQREISVTYDDLLFGVITRNFYCTNVPWIKERLPEKDGDYISEVKIQLASTSFMKARVVDVPMINPAQSMQQYLFKINGYEFSDVIAINGFSGNSFDQSLESQTGLTLDGKFHIPIIGSRSMIEIKAIEYMDVNRFRQLGKQLGFGKTGERSHMLEYVDEVHGRINVKFYCTQITGYRQKLPTYPYHFVKDVKFQQTMKQFI